MTDGDRCPSCGRNKVSTYLEQTFRQIKVGREKSAISPISIIRVGWKCDACGFIWGLDDEPTEPVQRQEKDRANDLEPTTPFDAAEDNSFGGSQD